ncbi:MAG TPA: hypothetical protein VM052_03175 [Candidatus Limnocylindrales bacterium]|nr:hypothetical protein [Candidatus Limnocylindrales bacterium]
MRPLALIGLALLSITALVVATRDPEESWAVGVVIVALALVSGVAAAIVQLRARRGGRRARAGAPSIRAARRGFEVAAIVGLLLWLRAVDGLSFLTAAFVIATFVAAELIASAPRQPSR